jgi:NADH-quinone oxidoreductase subunit G
MPKIWIDEREIEVRDGENLIDAAARAGIHIPHFCYHPALSVAGNCRQCLVEVEGVAKPQIACNTAVKEGMRIRCDTPAIQEARRGVLEFLLLNHPIDCPICDQAGECRLQEYYMQHGLYDSRREVHKVNKAKVVDLGPLVVLDAERCVLCSRCVRFCQEVAKVEELYIAERGHTAEITTFPGKQLENPYSGNVVDICPVGALLSRDFRFKSRVWWLKQADSLCASCARGCNVRLDHHWNRVQRVVPRFNPDVNSYWMCDRGRLDYRWINENRLVEPRLGGRDLPLREALDALAERLSGAPNDVAVLLSPKLCNEDLLVLHRLFTSVRPAKVLGAGSLEPPQPEDDILRRADPHPNSWAVRALGLDADVRAVVGDSGARILLLFGDDPLRWDPELGKALARYDFVAAALTNEGATAAAVEAAGGLLLPLGTHAEFAGSLTNFAGRVQRFAPALSPWGSARPAYEYGLEIAVALGAPFWKRAASPQQVLASIWEHCLPTGTELKPVTWTAVEPGEIVPVAHRTAEPTTKDPRSGSGAIVWRI